MKAEFDFRNKANVIFFIALSTLFLIVSYLWACIAQWREDQSINIFLSSFFSMQEVPFGLISSKLVHNPNGMILLGKIFNYCQNLTTISFMLHIIQFVAIGFMCWSLLRDRNRYILPLFFISFLVLVRASGGEFWNNWVLTIFNCIFLGSVFQYLKKPRWACTLIWVICILWVPAIYLAGVFTVIICIFFAYYVWAPYFSILSTGEISLLFMLPMKLLV